MRRRDPLLLLLLTSLVSAQVPTSFRPLDRPLPAAIQAFHAELPGPNLAWAVVVRPGPGIELRNLVSETRAGKEAMTAMARKAGAVVAINTVYFNVKSEPCRVVGWLVAGGRERSAPVGSVQREGKDFPVARAAFALGRDGRCEFGWAAVEPRGVVRLTAAWDGASELRAVPWLLAETAFSAGPMLWCAGRSVITRKEERLFEGEDVRHPRTALGRTKDGRLVMVVVDGRYKDRRSVGMTLAELAQLMGDLGCVDALNLDGGGSSTLVIGGELVNRPEGGTFERPVPAGFGVFVPAAASQPASQPDRGGR